MRAGDDGAVEVVQRAAQRGDAAGDAADDRPGAGELPADHVRSAGRHHRRRRHRRRHRIRLRPTCSICPARCSSSSRSRWPAPWLSMRIPRWVEVTAGEVPTTLSYRQGRSAAAGPRRSAGQAGRFDNRWAATSSPSLWGNCTIKVMVGFLFLYPAFVAKAHRRQRVGAARDAGADRRGRRHRQLRRQLRQRPAAVGQARGAGGALHHGGHRHRAGGGGGRQPADGRGIATLVTSGSSAIAKAALDASLQDDLPGGITRVGVRAFGVDAAAGLGPRRRAGRAALHRPVGRLQRRRGQC